MMGNKKSFVLHLDDLESVNLLTDEQAGQLLREILNYVNEGDTHIEDPVVEMAFSFIRRRIDKEAEKYTEICRKRAEASSSRWKNESSEGGNDDANASKCMQMHANASKPMQVTPDNDIDNDIDIDIDINKNNIVPPETGRRGEPIPYQAVIDHLNKVCGTKYAATTAKTRECIRARCREGATLEGFITVIDRKAKEWLGTEQAKYLRPETLFGTKFDGYLNAPRAAPKKPAKQFNDFHQRDQDYDAISKALIEKQLAALGATSVVDAAQWQGAAEPSGGSAER